MPGQLQQFVGGVQGGVLGPPDQRLMRVDLALAQVGQGLEHAVQPALAHQARQRAGAPAGDSSANIASSRLHGVLSMAVVGP